MISYVSFLLFKSIACVRRKLFTHSPSVLQNFPLAHGLRNVWVFNLNIQREIYPPTNVLLMLNESRGYKALELCLNVFWSMKRSIANIGGCGRKAEKRSLLEHSWPERGGPAGSFSSVSSSSFHTCFSPGRAPAPLLCLFSRCHRVQYICLRPLHQACQTHAWRAACLASTPHLSSRCIFFNRHFLNSRNPHCPQFAYIFIHCFNWFIPSFPFTV